MYGRSEQVSPQARSDELSNKALYPGFARVHPTDPQAAAALTQAMTMQFWCAAAVKPSQVTPSQAEPSKVEPSKAVPTLMLMSISMATDTCRE